MSIFWCVDVLVCRRFGLSTFGSVNVSVCRRFDQLPSRPLFIVTLDNALSSGWILQYIPKICARLLLAVLCCGYTLTVFPISIRLTSLALLQSNDCPSASKATLMNMDKLFMWIHYERLHNHHKAKHNKTVCIFLGIYYRSFTITKVTTPNDFLIWSTLVWFNCLNLYVNGFYFALKHTGSFPLPWASGLPVAIQWQSSVPGT